MKIAIKTKNRIKKFRKKTYNSIIKKYDFDETLVHLFVSNDTDVKNYSKEFPLCKVIKGPDGICQIDNFIVDYFDEGEVYLYMNDDVSGIYEATSKKDLIEVKDLKGLLNKLIKECQNNGYSYGGFAPVCNPYFMFNQKPISKKLCLVMDPLSICINNKNIKLTPIPVPMPDGSIFNGESSDAEKCILHYKDRGGIIRFNHFAPKVEYYGKQGGYQGRNAYTQKYTAEFMLNKYPNYISGINFKKNGNTSLRLKKNVFNKKTKIFIIGFNKTGTRTLNHYFKKNKIPSIHWDGGNLARTMKKNFESGSKLLTGYERYQCFSDMESGRPLFYAHLEYWQELYKQYPNSQFILNIRDVNNWITSRLKHKHGSYGRGCMKKNNVDLNGIKILWKNQFNNHVSEVKKFFKNKHNLLIFNIENDKPEKLNKFFYNLNLNAKYYKHCGKSK